MTSPTPCHQGESFKVNPAVLYTFSQPKREKLQLLGIMACERSNTTTTLCDLPMDLLLEIIQHLDNPALLSLGLTCRCVSFLALDTFFANNNIHDPRSGWLIAYNTPVETLPAFRNALFLRRLEQVHYYFNPGVERMLGEVRDLHALISRMPTISVVKLHFSVVDGYFAREERQVLNSEVWKKEFQGLLDLVLEKGCYELFVRDGASLIGLYPEHVVEFSDVEGGFCFILSPPCLIFAVAREKAIESDLNLNVGRKKRKRKNLLGAVQLRPLIQYVNRFFAPGTQNVKPESPDGQKVTSTPIVPVCNIKPTKVSIHSEMLLRNPFFEWTVAMLNSGASTITVLSMKLSDLPQDIWKRFLNGVTLSQLSDFEITSELIVPVHAACFVDVRSFLGHHPSIETLILYGVEVPKGVWPPPSLTIPILPRLKSLLAHPFYVVWILNGLLLDKKAFPTLTDIGISSEYYRNTSRFDYALFDAALERVAVFPRNVKLTLRFASSDKNGINNWFMEHASKANDTSKSSVISRLNNVTSLVISSFYFVHYDRKLIEVLPDWLGMFPNVTAIEFADQPEDNIRKLEEKEFVTKVAIACWKVGVLDLHKQKLRLDKVRRDFKTKMNAKDCQGSRKG